MLQAAIELISLKISRNNLITIIKKFKTPSYLE